MFSWFCLILELIVALLSSKKLEQEELLFFSQGYCLNFGFSLQFLLEIF